MYFWSGMVKKGQAGNIPPMNEVFQLRASKESYARFLLLFLPVVVGTVRWKSGMDMPTGKKGTKNNRTDFHKLVNVTDEAFLLLVFENAFNVWVKDEPGCQLEGWPKDKCQYTQVEEAGESDEATAAVEQSSGNKKASKTSSKAFDGWSMPGKERYNALCEKVKDDRYDVDKGGAVRESAWEFVTLMHTGWDKMTATTAGGKRKSDDESENVVAKRMEMTFY